MNFTLTMIQITKIDDLALHLFLFFLFRLLILPSWSLMPPCSLLSPLLGIRDRFTWLFRRFHSCSRLWKEHIQIVIHRLALQHSKYRLISYTFHPLPSQDRHSPACHRQCSYAHLNWSNETNQNHKFLWFHSLKLWYFQALDLDEQLHFHACVLRLLRLVWWFF